LLGPGPGFDREYAMGTGLAVPVIVATMPAVIGPLLIDGYARPVTVRSEAAAVHWPVSEPEPVRPATPADSTMR
jgi:hypothetical protein